MQERKHKCYLICAPVNDSPGLMFQMEVTKEREDEINVSPVEMFGGSMDDLSESSREHIQNWAKEEAIRVADFGDCYLYQYEELH